MATLLLIDDEHSIRMLLQTFLEDQGYCVVTAGDGKQALWLLAVMSVDAVIVDIFMPEMDGLEFISSVRTTRPTIKVIAMSGEAHYLKIAKHRGADDTISKPFNLDDLLTKVLAQLVNTAP